MKTTLSLFLFLACGLQISFADQTPDNSLPPPTPYRIVEQGGDHNVWQWETYETLPNGKIATHIHKFTELATGLNFQDANGNWQATREEIDLLPDGTAAATHGQHQAYFPGDIYEGAITLVTPDNKTLKSQPIGLDYDDGEHTVWIATVTNAVGQLLGNNQVIYANAFQGIDGDVVYTYRKDGFEQDVILRTQPPSPENLGLNPNTTRLQLLTEFFNPPEPNLGTHQLPAQADVSLTDARLDFGVLKIASGRAFLIGSAADTNNIWVAKQWINANGRHILVEEVPVLALADELSVLPLTASIGGTGSRHMASGKWQLPAQHLAQAGKRSIKTVRLTTSPMPGLVLDYNSILSNQNNFTFQGDTTYYLPGGVYLNLNGTTTIEGGAVIKYSTTNFPDLECWGPVNFQTSPYHPFIITVKDDNTVGETIPGSTGNPVTSTYAGNALVYDYNSFNLPYSTPLKAHDLQMRYVSGGLAVGMWNSDVVTHELKDCQFNHVLQPIIINGATGHLTCRNILIWQAQNAFIGFNNGSFSGENITFHDVDTFYNATGTTPSLALTNCLFISVTNWGDAATKVSCATNAYDAGVFQPAGAGSHYLATNSPYRNAGTTNISPGLLAELAAKTTYPPIIYSNTTIATATTFNPQAQRDNSGSPDLGYHYDPLDYCFGGVTATTNLNFTAGTAVGWFELPGSGGTGFGIALPPIVTVTYAGTVTAPCVQARYSVVQEGGNGLWKDKGYLGGIIANTANPTLVSSVNATFTHFAEVANDPNNMRDDGCALALTANDCEFWSGDQGGYGMLYSLTNCLIDRTYLALETSQAEGLLAMRNCTMRGSVLSSTHDGSATWPTWIENCAFDGTDLSWVDDPSGGNTNITYCDYNAFLTNTLVLPMVGPHDKLVTNFNWQTSWFGNFYLPTNSPLTNAGSVTADIVGLYHFTTLTNQVPETNSTVDIGYHYVATDTNGIPLDNNGDGIPDYIEDANGNGLVDSGEIGWNIVGDLGLKVFITRPRSNSSLP